MSARLIVGRPSSDIAGVAPGVRLISERVLGARGTGSNETIVRGIRHALNAGAKVIYVNLGGSDSDEHLQEVIEEARAAGCLTIAPLQCWATSRRTS